MVGIGSTLAAVNSAEELIEIAPRVQPHLLNTVPYVIRRALGVARGRSIRAALGARLRWLGCGGAALDPAIFAKLKSDGIEVIQGYGLTETSPVICSAQPGSTEPGSVGPPIAGVEVRIDDNQEVWCRGPAVMIGYWQDDQATCQRVYDGWLHTGDVGSWSPSGQLRVHGRRDDVITLSTGHKVTPQQIELALMQRDEFEHVIVAGQGHSGLTALIYVRDTTLNGDEAKCLAICAAVLRDALWYEQIKRVEFLPRRLSEENGELTVKGTPRRNVVLERYYRG